MSSLSAGDLSPVQHVAAHDLQRSLEPQGKNLWLVRHGTNEKIEDGYEGNIDPDLSTLGQQEVQMIARELAVSNLPYPVVILSSSANRATQTAGLIEKALVPAGKVHHFQLGELLSDDEDDLKAIFRVIGALDNIELQGKSDSGESVINSLGTVGSLIIIGHKRNMLLETVRMVTDPVGEVERLRGDGPGAEEPATYERLHEVADDEDELRAYLGGDDDMDIFEEARLVGYHLEIEGWSDYPAHEKSSLICDKSFSATGKRCTLLGEQRRMRP